MTYFTTCFSSQLGAVHRLQPSVSHQSYFHYLVPTPVSPSKSVSTPSETGSQDSADGGAASR